MGSAKDLAEKASVQSFLNCYLRETGQGEWISSEQWRKQISDPHHNIQIKTDSVLTLHLVNQGIYLYLGVAYYSPTGRHLFEFPIYFQTSDGHLIETDYVTFIALLVKELSMQFGQTYSDELILRVIQSCHNIESYIQERADESEELYNFHSDFLKAEQALLFGHLVHPTPKSRQGFPEWNQGEFSPELKGRFQLHYFMVHPDLVLENSAISKSASELIKEQLRKDPAIPTSFLEQLNNEPEYAFIPIHPIQAEWLKGRADIQSLLKQGRLKYLGPAGRKFSPTSSLRTVYHAEADYMYKLSLQVKVTNSLRVNKLKELESGVEVKKLLQTVFAEVKELFPGFDLICDPAYITLKIGEAKESGFEVILRENVFKGDQGDNVTLIAALVQDPLPGHQSRLATIIQYIAEKEKRSIRDVSLDWFIRYLSLSVKPMIWLYEHYGIALEAHQQNSLIRLEDGYPSQFYFRDNQGYYYRRSALEHLDQVLPGIGQKSDNVYDDHLSDERFRYYLIVNHIFGLINGFGVAGLIDERELLLELRRQLEEMYKTSKFSRFLYPILFDSQLSCKANLLTRLLDIDELTSPLEQAVYVPFANPLALERTELKQEDPYEFSC